MHMRAEPQIRTFFCTQEDLDSSITYLIRLIVNLMELRVYPQFSPLRSAARV